MTDHMPDDPSAAGRDLRAFTDELRPGHSVFKSAEGASVRPLRAADGNISDDVTTRLCREKVDGRLLTETELVSILRNWTGGDPGSIALCVGVLVANLAEHPEHPERLRSASDDGVEAVMNEVLRLDDPFVSNRRITTCPVQIGGRKIPSGATVKLNWTSANRDESVFDNNRFDSEKTRRQILFTEPESTSVAAGCWLPGS